MTEPDRVIVGGQSYTITPVMRGYHVKALDSDEYGLPRCVHVMQMIYNWRIVRSVGICDDIYSGYDRGWCYQGTGLMSLALAIGEGATWDGGDDTEPEGWIRRAL